MLERSKGDSKEEKVRAGSDDFIISRVKCNASQDFSQRDGVMSI